MSNAPFPPLTAADLASIGPGTVLHVSGDAWTIQVGEVSGGEDRLDVLSVPDCGGKRERCAVWPGCTHVRIVSHPHPAPSPLLGPLTEETVGKLPVGTVLVKNGGPPLTLREPPWWNRLVEQWHLPGSGASVLCFSGAGDDSITVVSVPESEVQTDEDPFHATFATRMEEGYRQAKATGLGADAYEAHIAGLQADLAAAKACMAQATEQIHTLRSDNLDLTAQVERLMAERDHYRVGMARLNERMKGHPGPARIKPKSELFCPDCDGRGISSPTTLKSCALCGGEGTLPVLDPSALEPQKSWTRPTHCANPDCGTAFTETMARVPCGPDRDCCSEKCKAACRKE